MTIKDVLKRLFFILTNRQSEKYKGEIRQVSIKEIHEAKKSLEEAGGIQYTGTKKLVAEDTLQEQHRYEVITALYEGINLSDEYKKQSIESLAKSKMSIEEIKIHVDQVRELYPNRIGGSSIQTKLPQKSIPDHIR